MRLFEDRVLGYLDRREIKLQEVGESSIMMSSIISSPLN
jgi:hypothetical protein